MNISHLQYLTVPVADHAKARDFYVDKLGFDLLVDVPGPHGRFVMVSPKGASTGLVLTDYEVDGLSFGGPLSFQLHTTDVDADVEALRAAGVAVEDPQELPWGRTASIKDPDGNGIGLLEPSEYGNWPR
ncbi:VOC family protein [Amycolatopsis sp. H20-H5]|uniref:VOC family protein n=1 Tax=Amycolatopsis sp. H20-H5 TaxID=3046309 RepID=UPI002DBB5316|nr:VOC family protein [Amycolatopsis sp. H20-H5]MEC3976824.1 VOC family protein [Amycolatopsis sp. H20-H5]